jgi:hypothetical protein
MSETTNDFDKTIKLLDEISEISNGIAQTHYELDSGDQINAMLTQVIAYMARTPRIEAEAEYLLNVAKGKKAQELKTETATVFRERLTGETATEQKIYKFAYRLNTHLPEIIGALRSQLSYVREQIPKRIDTDIRDEMSKLSKEVTRLKQKLDDKL